MDFINSPAEGHEMFFNKIKSGGIPEWNHFRQNELANVDLEFEAIDFNRLGDNLDLSGIDLSHTNLNNAEIPKGLILREANLQGSEFGWSILAFADFSGSNLRRANFHRSYVHRHCFNGADLREANFSWTTLAEAVPYQKPDGKMGYTLVATDLSNANIEGLWIFAAQILTELGYMKQGVFSVQEFYQYCEKAGVKTEGMHGEPCSDNIEWVGVFKTFRPRY